MQPLHGSCDKQWNDASSSALMLDWNNSESLPRSLNLLDDRFMYRPHVRNQYPDRLDSPSHLPVAVPLL